MNMYPAAGGSALCWRFLRWFSGTFCGKWQGKRCETSGI